MNFEEGTKKLESIITKLDASDVTLDNSIKLFEQGVAITRDCLEILDTSKGKITEIKMAFDKLVESPMDSDK